MSEEKLIKSAAIPYVIETKGPNTINREKVKRRIVVQCNAVGRDFVSVVLDIQAAAVFVKGGIAQDFSDDIAGRPPLAAPAHGLRWTDPHALGALVAQAPLPHQLAVHQFASARTAYLDASAAGQTVGGEHGQFRRDPL